MAGCRSCVSCQPSVYIAKTRWYPNRIAACIVVIKFTVSRGVNKLCSRRSFQRPLWPRHGRQRALSPRCFRPRASLRRGDDNAVYNLFATYPKNYFSSLPKPHSNRGIDKPYWEVRQSRILLDDHFQVRSCPPGPTSIVANHVTYLRSQHWHWHGSHTTRLAC